MKELKKIDEEIADLEKQLATYKALLQRKSDLQQLRLLTIRLYGKGGEAQQSPAAPVAAPARNELNHADYLRAAITRHGPMPIAEILRAVRADGWQGSGKDKIDKKRLRVVLYRDKSAFRSLGDGRWGLVQGTLAATA
jgi:hypothetical protein